MAKRKKRAPTDKVSYRWPSQLVAAAGDLAELTGWSESRASAFLANMGTLGLYENGAGLAAERAVVEAAKVKHAAERKAAELVKGARVEYRRALAKSTAESDGHKF